jgi:putative spermidine/putrescine transport system permease protein
VIERWGRKRFAGGIAFTVLLAAIAILPPLAAVAASFGRSMSEQWSSGPYAYVLSTYGGSLILSVKLALTVTAASLLIAAPAAYGLSRHPFPGSRSIEQLALVPLSLPGISVAIAIIAAYIRWRGNIVLLACGQMLYTIPYVLRVFSNAIRLAPLEELGAAAQTLGAKRWDRLRRVTSPLLLHPFVLSALLVFSISWGEFNVSFMLATPLQMSFPAALYAAFTSNSPAVSGAATAIFLIGAAPFLVAIQLIEGAAVAELRN